MAENCCPQCGAPIEPGARECKYCGHDYQVTAQSEVQQYVSSQPQPAQVPPVYNPQPQYNNYGFAGDPSWPVRNKLVAGILAIILGSFGAHKFYLGKTGVGILYLCFCWTYIPGIIGFVEGILYLVSSDQDFMMKNHVRLDNNHL